MIPVKNDGVHVCKFLMKNKKKSEVDKNPNYK